MDDFDKLFDGEQEVETQGIAEQPIEVEAEQAQSEPQGDPDADQGQAEPTGENNDATPVSSEKVKGQEAAIVAERKKRQAAETRIADMERQLTQLQAAQTPPAPVKPAPDMFADPQAWQQHNNEAVQSSAVEQATFNAKLQMSEMMASQKHGDFTELQPQIDKWLRENPAMINQANATSHPWDHAYTAFKNYTAMQELGATDIASMKEQMREQIMAEQAQAQQQAPNLPQSLAGAQSANRSGTQSGPLSLEEILG